MFSTVVLESNDFNFVNGFTLIVCTTTLLYFSSVLPQRILTPPTIDSTEWTHLGYHVDCSIFARGCHTSLQWRLDWGCWMLRLFWTGVKHQYDQKDVTGTFASLKCPQWINDKWGDPSNPTQLLITGICYDTHFVFTDGTVYCRYDNLCCHQWRQISISSTLVFSAYPG